ncbi:MAG: hypothetical protein NTV25_04565 [Methanothrix sp.]|nr:hypothetical protein [Methanothrix sp.]
MRSCPSQAAFNRAAKPHPYRPHRRQSASLLLPFTSGPAGTCDPGRLPGERASIHAAKSNPSRRPSPPKPASLPPPHERASEHAGGATGDPARPE